MNTYIESRYGKYKDMYPGDRIIKLLPDEYRNLPIHICNSFLVNAPLERTFNIRLIKSNKEIKEIFRCTKLIDANRSNGIFQIVIVNETPYINPWFEQPPEILFKDRVRIGNMPRYERNTLLLLNSLFGHVVNEPTDSSICITNNHRGTQTLKYKKAVAKGNQIFSIQEYLDIVKSSHIWMYFK